MLPSPLPTYKPKAAQDAANRRRLLWTAGTFTAILIILALASLVNMWVFLAPLGFMCLGAMAIGLLRAVQNRGVPYLPDTGRGHSVFLILIAPAIFILAFDLGPKTFAQRQYWGAVKQRLEEIQQEQQAEEARRRADQARRQAEENSRAKAQTRCEVYILNRLKAPSSAVFSPRAVIESRKEGGYLVGGFVEAQNMFGVMLRRNYVCELDAGGQVITADLLE